jgi:O-acetyl-ADP-ribose deacetylase (regulator of RNase III)
MKLVTGNLFTSTCQTLVNTVNCFGVMGAGLALECRYRYPNMFTRYEQLCAQKQLTIGSLYLYKAEDRWILNFPTKNHWKYDSKPEYLVKGLQKFVSTYEQKGILSVAFPLLGANHGGLDPEESLSLMKVFLEPLTIPVEIYSFIPDADDDLFEIFRNRLLSIAPTDLKSKMQMSLKNIALLKDLLQAGTYHNMMQFISSRGIGEKTALQCFRFAMESTIIPKQTTLL